MDDIRNRIKRHLERNENLKDMNPFEQICFLIELNEDLIASNAALVNHLKLLNERMELLEEQMGIIESHIGLGRAEVLSC